MAKHIGSLDVRKDLRVRGRVEENLRVRKEVEASAFYIRGTGEVGASFSRIAYATSSSNTEATVEGNLTVSVIAPATGTFKINVDVVVHGRVETNAGAGTATVTAELYENPAGAGFSLVASSRKHQDRNGDDVPDDHTSPIVVFHHQDTVTNGATYTYRVTPVLASSLSGAALLDADGAVDVKRLHSIRVTLLPVG